MNARRVYVLCAGLAIVVAPVIACGDDGKIVDEDTGTSTGDGDPGDGDGDPGDGDGDPGDGDGDPGDGDGDPGDGDGDPGDGDGDPPAVCDSPLPLYDTSQPSAVIGTGTPESCTGAALTSAAEAGGTITFDCGPDPVTITLDQTITLPIDVDTIIDGEGLVTLDAGGQVRHFMFNHPDWMNNPTKIVLQRMTFINGAAQAGEYFPQDPQNPDCAYGYKEGSGGVIYVRNGVLHVIDSHFHDNAAALEGPDIAGGAIYVLGVPELIISGSSFMNNRASNGGAVGMLFANPQIYNSIFEGNTAEGVGQNYVEPGCPNFNHDEQGGAGGNSGAVVFDGLNDEDEVYTICGSVFRNNKANELGGALFRTPNAGQREMLIDQCLFDGNTGRLGGVSFIKDNLVTVRASTFMNNRSGVNVAGEELGGPLGGLWINNGTIDLENSTFYANSPSGLDVEGGGTVTNASFIDSRIGGGFTVNNSLFVDTSCGDALNGANNLQWPEQSDCVQGIAFGDPQIDAIGDHGGATPTALPAADGAASGVGVDCPALDQRGEPRDPSSCAAGSVEP
jgi:hypothetical protein